MQIRIDPGLKRKYVFVHIPRTGGMSVRNICDIFGITAIGHNLRYKNYLSIAKYKERYNKNCFAFTFVRSPWDRVVSAFHFLMSGGLNEEDKKDYEEYISKYNGDFRKFVIEAFNDNILEQLHFRPQYKWICNDEGKLVVDFVGKFENFQLDFHKICEIMDIEKRNLPHQNKSSHKHYREYYDEEMKKVIAKAYRKDIEMFDYSF